MQRGMNHELAALFKNNQEHPKGCQVWKDAMNREKMSNNNPAKLAFVTDPVSTKKGRSACKMGGSGRTKDSNSNIRHGVKFGFILEAILLC